MCGALKDSHSEMRMMVMVQQWSWVRVSGSMVVVPHMLMCICKKVNTVLVLLTTRRKHRMLVSLHLNVVMCRAIRLIVHQSFVSETVRQQFMFEW